MRSPFKIIIPAAVSVILSMSLCQGQDIQTHKIDSLYSEYKDASEPRFVRSKAVPLANEIFAELEDLTEERITVKPSDSDNEIQGNLYSWLAEWQYTNQDFQKAVEMASISVDNALNTTDKELQYNALSIFVVSCIRTGDYSSAITRSEMMLSIARELDDNAKLSSALNSIAGTYLAMREYEEAADYADEAIRIERRNSESTAPLAIRLGIASEIYTGLNEYQKAIGFAQEAYDLDMAASRTDRAAVRLSQLGSAYLAAGKAQEAKKALLDANAILEKTGNINSIAINCNQIGAIALKEGDLQSCRQNLEKTISICESTGNRMIESKAHLTLSEAFQKTDPSYALSHLQQYMKISEVINSEQNAKDLADFNIKYESAQKEAQIIYQKAQLHRRNAILWILVIVIAFLTVLIHQQIIARRILKRNLKMSQTASEISEQIESITQVASVQPDIKEELEDMSEKLKEIDNTEVVLTKREKQIAALSCEGLINKEIADRLGIGVRTVETHKANIYRKLEINSNNELVDYARKVGLLDK